MKFNHLNFKAMKKTIVMMAALMLTAGGMVYAQQPEKQDTPQKENPTAPEQKQESLGYWQVLRAYAFGPREAGTDSRRAGIGTRRAKIGAGEDGEERKPGESVGRGRPVIFRPKSFS